MAKKDDKKNNGDAATDKPHTCPECGGEFIVDQAHNVDKLVERKMKNTANPSVVQRFAEATRAKVAELGVLVKCRNCGYVDRQKPPAAAAEPQPAAAQ